MGGQPYQDRDRKIASIPYVDQDDPLSRYIGRPANTQNYQRQPEIARPNPKTPLFEEFESLRQEMLVDSRNTRMNRWREDTRSRGNTREREAKTRTRAGISGYLEPRQPSKERIHHRTEIRDPTPAGSELLDQIVFSEFAVDQNKIGLEPPKPQVSIHEVRDQLAFPNRVHFS